MIGDRKLTEATEERQLRTVLATARRIAAAPAFRVPVAPRELLLAAATLQPDLVVAVAKRREIDVRRLRMAMREWGPIEPVDPASAAEVALTPEARNLVKEVTQSSPGKVYEELVERLLDPARLPSRVHAAAPEADGGAPLSEQNPAADAHSADVTGVVLSRLGLI